MAAVLVHMDIVCIGIVHIGLMLHRAINPMSIPVSMPVSAAPMVQPKAEKGKESVSCKH
jgi:hypothetical protein